MWNIPSIYETTHNNEKPRENGAFLVLAFICIVCYYNNIKLNIFVVNKESSKDGSIFV